MSGAGGITRLLPLLLASCAWWQTGRVIDGPCTHLGVRPATDLSGVAVTVQVAHDLGPCARRP